MSKIIAIAFSDLHLYKFKNFNSPSNSRLRNSLGVLEDIAKAAFVEKVPVLFCGDLFHNPKETENQVMSGALQHYSMYFESYGTEFMGISGNHDLSEKNGGEHSSPSHLESLKHFTTFTQMDNIWINKDNFSVWGLPYMNNDFDLKTSIDAFRPIAKQQKSKLKILMLHSDAPGAVTTEGITVNETEYLPKALDEFFAEWDLVIMGHIHKPQRLGKKVYMLGSPIHQIASDRGVKMGYWEIYSDKTMKFVELDKYPKFRKLKPGKIPPENSKDYWIKPDEAVVEENIEVGEFNATLSKSKLARRYLRIKDIKNKSRRRALISILNSVE